MTRFDQERGFRLAEFKAAPESTGEFEAIVSVFNNVDLGGDRILPGAFSKSLAKWQEAGDPIPVIWNHMWENPEAHIGAIDPGDAVETDAGLQVKGRLDVDKPFAAQVFHLLKQRRVREFSFGYNVRDAKRDAKGVNELLDLDVIEVGPTLKGMNPATELLAVKALAAELEPDAVVLELVPEFKTGARLSKASRTVIEQIAALANDLLAADRTGGEQETVDEAESKASVDGPRNTDEAESKASDPVVMDVITRINLLKET